MILVGGQVGFNGQKTIITPNLDKFAKDGIKFNNFYTSAPFCPPARNSLMTGLHTGESVWKATDIEFGREPTMPQMFKNHGYHTSVFGKWGMALPKLSAAESHNYKLTCSNMDQFYSTLPQEFESAGDPVDSGFDEGVFFMDHRDAHVYYHDSPDTPEESTPEHPYVANVIRQDLYTINGNDISRWPTTKDMYLPDAITTQALNSLEESVKSGKPFFMYFPSQLPHAELVDPPGYEGLYTDGKGNSLFPETVFEGNTIFKRKVETPRTTLARMVTRLDHHVGQLVNKLKDLGVYEDTIIIFSSDNGHHTAGGMSQTVDFFDSNGGHRGHKWWLFEGGIKVPTIIFGGGIEPRVVDTRYAQYQIKDSLEEMLTGNRTEKSFYPVLEGESVEQLDYLYFQYLHDQKFYFTNTVQAVIKGDYKLIRFNKEDPHFRMYDLRYKYEVKDVKKENCNLAVEMAEILRTEGIKNGLPDFKFNCYAK